MFVTVSNGFAQTAYPPDPRDLGAEFTRALRSNNQPGGAILTIQNCGTGYTGEKPVQLQGAKTRLLQIAAAHPGYTVTNTDVPNFVPKAYEPALLRERIDAYTLDTDNSPAITLHELLSLDELKPAVAASGLLKGLYFGGLQPPPWKAKHPRRTQALRQITLREALNSMAAFYETGRWVYHEIDGCDPGRLTRIYFSIY